MTAERKIEHFTPGDAEMNSAKEMIKLLDTIEGYESIKGVMIAMLERVAAGQSVSLLSNDHEFTTTEAAKLLHVSKTFLLKILDEGKLPCRKVGAHRRIRAQDLIAYKSLSEKKRLAAIEEMTRISQEIEEA